jgi:hypothetical protein
VNNSNKGDSNSRVPFAPINRPKRQVNVTTAFDPKLRMPTHAEMQPKRKVMANTPIAQRTAVPSMPSQIMEFNFDEPMPAIPDSIAPRIAQQPFVPPAPVNLVNNPDLSVFDDEFDKQNMPSNSVELRVEDRIQDSVFVERIALPSGGIFYDFNSVQIRPFKVPELAALYKAKKRKDTVLLYDTLDKTINVDIRNLWTVDAKFIMYWHRMNSFIKTPYRATWESIYGNTNKTKITMSDIKVTPITMTKLQYAEWYAQGFKAPTIRDAEHLDTFRDKLSEDELWMYERALYLQGKDLHEQKEKLESENGIDILYAIKDFIAALSENTIVETAKAKDVHFNYLDALRHLGAEIEVIDSILSNEINLDENAVEIFTNKKIVNTKEIARLAALNPGEAEPLLETITLRLGILDFFPDL